MNTKLKRYLYVCYASEIKLRWPYTRIYEVVAGEVCHGCKHCNTFCVLNVILHGLSTSAWQKVVGSTVIFDRQHPTIDSRVDSTIYDPTTCTVLVAATSILLPLSLCYLPCLRCM